MKLFWRLQTCLKIARVKEKRRLDDLKLLLRDLRSGSKMLTIPQFYTQNAIFLDYATNNVAF